MGTIIDQNCALSHKKVRIDLMKKTLVIYKIQIFVLGPTLTNALVGALWSLKIYEWNEFYLGASK